MRKFKKVMLLSYELEYINEDKWRVILTYKISTWWGLKTRIINTHELVSGSYGPWPNVYTSDKDYAQILNKWF